MKKSSSLELYRGNKGRQLFNIKKPFLKTLEYTRKTLYRSKHYIDPTNIKWHYLYLIVIYYCGEIRVLFG